MIMSWYTCICGDTVKGLWRALYTLLLQHPTISETQKWNKKKRIIIISVLNYFPSWLTVLRTVSGRFVLFSLSFSR